MTVENPETKPQKVPGAALEQKEAKEREKQNRETLKDFVRQQVLQALGKPTDLFRVQVRPLWDNKYRANVFVGVHAGSVKVANSYFLVVDGEGKILQSTPKLQKQY